MTASKIFLILSSLFFYGWWNTIYLPLILGSILFNFTITNLMSKFQKTKKHEFSNKILLQIGLLFNIGLLVYFKYMDFFIYNINTLLNYNIDTLKYALPLAISFFTLQQIAFLIDKYEGLINNKSFLDYSLFVLFFPQLIAGPIVHHKQMMPQFFNPRNKIFNKKNIMLGLLIFSIGLFKKVIIADTFAIWATSGFDNSISLNLLEAWATSLSYTIQLYFDFSGYTDMAIGAALLFNIRLPQNFNSPFKASGMLDFWKRWHMTLTNFITTYIYTPIIRSYKNLTFHKAMIATFITFLIAGLWHGASWMFVIFGGLNGIGLIINHYWKRRKIKLNKVLAWFITFNFVNITFVFFRAKDWDEAVKVLHNMFSLDDIVLPTRFEGKLAFLSNYGVEFGKFATNLSAGKDLIIWLIIAFTIILLFKNSMERLKFFKPNIINSFIFITAFTTSFYKLSGYSEFLYFRF